MLFRFFGGEKSRDLEKKNLGIFTQNHLVTLLASIDDQSIEFVLGLTAGGKCFLV